MIDNVNEVKTRIEGVISPYKNKVILGSIILACILFCIISFTIGRYHPNEKTLRDLLDKQLIDAKEKYNTDISAKNKQIDELARLLEDSYKKNTKHYQNLVDIKKEYSLIKKPKTREDAIKIMKELGYETH